VTQGLLAEGRIGDDDVGVGTRRVAQRVIGPDRRRVPVTAVRADTAESA